MRRRFNLTTSAPSDEILRIPKRVALAENFADTIIWVISIGALKFFERLGEARLAHSVRDFRTSSDCQYRRARKQIIGFRRECLTSIEGPPHKLLLMGKYAVEVLETLDFDGIAGGIEEKHRPLFPGLAFESDNRRNIEGNACLLQPLGEDEPVPKG